MPKYMNCIILVMHLLLLQGCASSYINDLAREHDVSNKPHSIDKAYIASCGKNNDEYLVVNLEGLYAKTDNQQQFSLLVNKDMLLNNKELLLDNEIVPTKEITDCTKLSDIYYKINVKEYCNGGRRYIVNELSPDIPITNEKLTGEFGLCKGGSTGNNYFYYNYIAEGQAKHSRLRLKSSVHSYPALNAFLPIAIIYDMVTFPLQIISCIATQGTVGCGGLPLAQI